MRPSNLLASLRNLATADLPGKMAWHALDPLLKAMIGFEHSALFWTGADGTIQDIQIQNEAAVVAAAGMFLNSPYCRGQAENSLPTYTDFLTAGTQDVESMSQYPGWHSSQLYQAVVRPIGVHHLIRAAVRQEGVPLACLTFGRELARDFGAKDTAKLQEILPLIGHVLSAQGNAPFDDGASADGQEMVVADEQGCIQHATSGACYMLHRAAGINLVPGTLSDLSHSEIKHLLREMALRVSRLERGQSAAVPVHVCLRADGRYIFRAYRLSGLASGRPLVAVQLEHQLPTTVRLYRGGRMQALPLREQQVVSLLLRGTSIVGIASELKLRRHTVIGYMRNLYRRLGISRSEDLLPALLGGAAAPGPGAGDWDEPESGVRRTTARRRSCVPALSS